MFWVQPHRHIADVYFSCVSSSICRLRKTHTYAHSRATRHQESGSRGLDCVVAFPLIR